MSATDAALPEEPVVAPVAETTNDQHPRPTRQGSAPMDQVRTDPIRMLEPRKRRLERNVEEKVPEIHIIGQISRAVGVLHDISEGFYVRWKIEHGKVWHFLEGDLSGQTHVCYGKNTVREELVLSHPFSVHFSSIGFQGWGAPRIVVQAFRMDSYGRRIVSGYGFVHIPSTPGVYSLEVPLWRPVGTPEQELKAFILGDTPSLNTPDPIYDNAWEDRCRLITTSCGSVFVDFHLITRFMKEQGLA